MRSSVFPVAAGKTQTVRVKYEHVLPVEGDRWDYVLPRSESLAADGYKDMLVASSMDDVLLTKAFTGLQTNMLRPSIVASGLDPDRLDEAVTPQQAREMFGPGGDGPRRWTNVWSAGHAVSGVGAVQSVDDLVADVAADYARARAAMA